MIESKKKRPMPQSILVMSEWRTKFQDIQLTFTTVINVSQKLTN